MKAYPAYKSSGVEWLEEIPEKWEFRPIKRIFSEVDIKKGNASYPLLSFSREMGLIIPPIDKKGVPDDLSCYKVLKKGQLLENRMQAWSGMFICADKDGCVSPDYSVFEAININTTSVKFYEYVFRNHIWVSLFANASKGIGTGFNRLYTPQFGAIKTIFPPVEEQNAIVAYLDKKCAEIDELVSRRQAIIERLKELKQSIIAEAVTKGLHPEVPMKESGIDWIPDIPVHWKVVRLRNLLHKTTEKGRPDLPLLSVVRELGVILRDVKSKEENHNYIPDDLSNYKVLREGQFVINKMKAWQGSYSVSSLTGIVSPAYFIYDVDYSGLTSQFFNTAIRSKAYIGFFNQASDGVRVGQWDLDEAQMRNIPLFVPTLEEQNAIVAYLDKKCAEIDELISRHERTIEKLKELKISTIANVVTGKVDVREGI